LEGVGGGLVWVTATRLCRSPVGRAPRPGFRDFGRVELRCRARYEAGWPGSRPVSLSDLTRPKDDVALIHYWRVLESQQP
jgi:hypothetical protein